MDSNTMEGDEFSIDVRNRLRDALSYVEGIVALCILAIYTAIIAVDVAQRTLWGTGFPWRLEIVLGLFTWMTWISAAFAIRHRSHLRFTLVRKAMSNRANYLLYWIEYAAWIGVMGVVLRFSVPIFLDRWETGRLVVGTEAVPSALLYLSVPVGMVLLILRATEDLVRVTREYRLGEDLTPSASIGTEEPE